MFILALVLSGIMTPLTNRAEQQQIEETNDALLAAREALFGFTAANGRLPRPAASATDGTERVAACVTEADCTGFLPWAELGVQRTDGWAKLLRYSVTPAYTVATMTLATAGTKVIQERDTTSPYALVSTAATPAPTAPPGTIPVVVFSHGRDNWGTRNTGATLSDSSTTNVDEDTNHTATTTFIRRAKSTSSTATGGEFDDIVTHISDVEILSVMLRAGKLQ